MEEIEGSSPKHSETWLHDRRNDSWRNGTCRKHPLCPLLKESQRGWHYLPLGDAPFLPTSPSQPHANVSSFSHLKKKKKNLSSPPLAIALEPTALIHFPRHPWASSPKVSSLSSSYQVYIWHSGSLSPPGNTSSWVPDTTLSWLCYHITSCYLALICVIQGMTQFLRVFSSPSSLSPLVLYPISWLFLEVLSNRYFLPRLLPESHTCMTPSYLSNISTGILNRHLNMSQTELIFFPSLYLLLLAFFTLFAVSSILPLSHTHISCSTHQEHLLALPSESRHISPCPLFHLYLSHHHVSLGWLQGLPNCSSCFHPSFL